jgi:uncharacterized protein
MIRMGPGMGAWHGGLAWGTDMWEKPIIQKLSDDRLQLRHGPIRVVLKAWGDPEVVRKAQRLVTRHFPKILPELGEELAALRKPSATKAAKFNGATAQRMADAAAPFAAVFVTPMAAVAGAVAEEILRIMMAAGPLDKAYVNDGGDIALHAAPGHALTFGIAGDFSSGTEQPVINGLLTLDDTLGLAGIATSGAHGRSFSLGIADSVTVLAKTAAVADVAATLIANAVNIESKTIKREKARVLDPDSDLGDMLVTMDVGRLKTEEVDAALDAGLLRAEEYLQRGLIAGACLMLRGENRTIGAPLTVLAKVKA